MTKTEPNGCLIAILSLFGIRIGASGRRHGLADEFPFRLCDDFLSAAELSFYGVLKLGVREQAIILAKVNLGDIFHVVHSDQAQSYRNKIDRKHVDFLLCDPKTIKPRLGIELDDSSHQRPDRRDRDQLVDAVFHAAGLPLLRCPARAAYDPNAIAEKVAPYVDADQKVATAPAPVLRPGQSPACPKCGIPMVQRVASKGTDKGKTFWGCPNYPKCRQIA